MAISGHPVTDWMRGHLLRAAAVRAAELGASDGTLMVVKGLHLGYALDMPERLIGMLDADLLVVEGSFDSVVKALTASGEYEVDIADWSTQVIRHRELGVHLDMHRLPFPPAFGALRGRDLARRASLSPQIFGSKLLVPDWDDAAALSIGHFVKDGFGVLGGSRRAERDLRALASRARVTPEALHRRLVESKMRGIGLAAMTALTEADPEWSSWLEPFGPSQVERRLTRQLVQTTLRRGAEYPRAAFLGMRSLGDAPWRCALGAGVTLARFLRDDLRAVRPNVYPTRR